MRIPDGPVDGQSTQARCCNREDFAAVAFAVEQDFRRLTDTLRRAIENAGNSDEELLLRLSRTKSVAERGVRLSRLLSNLTRHKQR